MWALSPRTLCTLINQRKIPGAQITRVHVCIEIPVYALSRADNNNLYIHNIGENKVSGPACHCLYIKRERVAIVPLSLSRAHLHDGGTIAAKGANIILSRVYIFRAPSKRYRGTYWVYTILYSSLSVALAKGPRAQRARGAAPPTR